MFLKQYQSIYKHVEKWKQYSTINNKRRIPLFTLVFIYFISSYLMTILSKTYYSATCAIRHLSFPTSCDIRQIFMVSRYFC